MNMQNPISSAQVFQSLGQNPPPMTFPTFNGENPQLWRTLSKQYYTMYRVHESYWVSMAIINFQGPASIWLQAVRTKILGLTWSSFCDLLCTRFGRDRHQALIRQFYAIHQTSSVTEYAERFETLMNHLMTYYDAIHPLYFLTRFIEELRGDIRAVVMVQRPLDLDTAVSLACLHEEVADGLYAERRSVQQYPLARLQPASHVPLALPPPPPVAAATPTKYPSLLSPSSTEDGRGTDSASKVAALKNYRRSRGLCFKCGERWGREHTCPPSVSLRTLEEMMDVLGFESSEPTEWTVPSGENLMALSY
uniref:Uncharacterized protein n=1 Tax=Avena sativa TaxID=4498 RepID=A0ACD5X0Q7_AVESA